MEIENFMSYDVWSAEAKNSSDLIILRPFPNRTLMQGCRMWVCRAMGRMSRLRELWPLQHERLGEAWLELEVVPICAEM